MTMAVSGVSATSNYYTQAASAGAVSIAVAVAAIKANSRTKVTISDTSANIAKSLDALGKLVNNITQITQSDPSVVMDVTASQQSKLGTLFGKFSTNYQLNVSGVTASAVAGLAANSHVATLTVTDTSSNITTQLNSLLSNKDKITSIIPSTRSTPISVTAAQMTSHADVLGKINGAYALSVSQATAAQAASYANDARVKSVSILDTAAGVSAKLDDLRALGLRLKEIRSSDAAVFQVTADQVQTDALVIGKIYRGFQLSVLNASMGQAQALSKDTKVISIDVADTAANLSSNLELLGKLGSHLHSVHVTDTANSLSMTSAQFGVYADVLAKIQAGDAYTVSVKEASVEEAQTLLGNAKVSAISVSDTSKSIAGSLHALNQNAKVSSIYQTGKTSPLAVTVGQLTDDATALSKLQGNYNLDVSGVTAGAALQLATSNSRITNLSVSDTAAQITAKLDDLAALGKRLGSVTQSDANTALRLSVGQWSSQIGVLAKITGGYSVALTGVSAAKAQSLASDSRVKSVAVSDTAQAISAQLDSLHTLGAQLESIARTDAEAVKLTATQYDNYGLTLDKLSAGYSLAVRDVAASKIGVVAANSKVSSVAVADSSANIASNLDAIQDVITAATASNSGLQVSVRQSGNLGTMSLTASQLSRDAGALGSIAGNYSLMVTGVLAANASTVAQNGKVVGMTVADSAANLVAKLPALTTLGTRVASITQTNPSTALGLSASDWSTYMGVLSKITGGYRVALSDVRVSGAQALLSDGRVQSVAVKDSAAQISSNLDMLQGLGPLLTAVGQTDTGTAISVGMNQLTANASTLAKLDAGYKLSVRDATAAQAQTLLGAGYSAVESVTVVDSSDNIASQLDALNANTKLAAIVQSGKALALTVTQSQMTADATALGKIRGSYSLAVSDAAAADVAALAGNSRVASMVVTDTGANILAKLSDLKAAGPKISTLNLSDPSNTLAMTYTQWAGHQGTLGKIAQNYSVSVSDVSAANAGSVAANTRVRSLAVSDSMARINSSLDSLQGLGPQLTAITATDSGTLPALVLTAAQKVADSSALAKLNAGTYTLAVTNANVAEAQAMASDAKVVSIAVSDSSDNIAGLLNELVANGKVSSVTQTGTPETMSLTATQLAASTALLAKFQNAYTLDVQGATMGTAAALQANTKVLSFTLSATTSEVASNLSTLASMGKLGDIKLSADDGLITLSETQMGTYADTLAQLQGVYRLKVTGVAMASLDTMASTPGVSAIELSADSQSISERFDDLLALGDTLTAITDTSSSTPIALTHGQWLQGAGVLGKLQGSYSLAVLDVAAENALTMKTQAHVATVSVADTASNISANFDSLLAMGSSLDAIELVDTNPVTITSAQNSAAGASAMLAKIIGDHEVVVEG